MSGVIDALGDAIERAMIGASVGVLDRHAHELRARGGDAAARAHHARMAEAMEAAAADVQALLGPLVPAQGRLALAAPEGR